MKKTFFLAAMCFVMATVTSCNQDRDMNESFDANPNMESVFSSKVSQEHNKKMIPICINKVNNAYDVLFDEETSVYTISDTEQNKKYVEIIDKAIENESSLSITINNNSITSAKVVHSSYPRRSYDCPETDYRGLKDFSNLGQIKKFASLLSKAGSYKRTPVQRNNGFTAYSWGIPNFEYRTDGCYARAHRMRQILKNYGYKCEKIWLFGNLRAKSGNKTIRWGWHVTIAVKLPNGDRRVIDPAFQDTPMSVKEWEDKCLDKSGMNYNERMPYKIASAFTTPSKSYLLHKVRGGRYTQSYDNCYEKTTATLNSYRHRRD
ncbi:protein-glutamine glutaminase family protein [Chryseobacterium potabilaquae]|uniref:Protein glutaminase domain-containing protein n=1 Tax=Chryseobacterium potabilaquae TaxID=2675057 RepID=A0A6N4X7C5_9FLAO|nr:protein-glutamine glutaminase family protein [Chryseobacterium potabilaquae]CAA7194076.1 hypothetical protein CHRY9293_00456 [Chryseobacterium potabilaquae]